MDTVKESKVHQEIHLLNRSELTVTSVEDVQSFDENSIILKSGYGMIAIDGSELKIVNLSVDSGELLVEGKIGGVVFFETTEKKKKRGLFS